MNPIELALGIFTAVVVMGFRDIFLNRRKMFTWSFYLLTIYALFLVLNTIGVPIFDLLCYFMYAIIVTITPLYVHYKGDTLFECLRNEKGKMTIKRNIGMILGKYKLLNVLYIIIMITLPVCVFIGTAYLSYINMLFVIITSVRNFVNYICIVNGED